MSLTPEQNVAFSTFKTNLTRWDKLLRVKEQKLEDLCVTGTAFFTNFILDSSNLPRDPAWLWNKSKPTQSYELGDGTEVSFYKLNSRKKRGEKLCPEFKVWIFNLTLPTRSQLSYFWCERGIELTPFTLKDLSFLSPYTTIEFAKSIGWL